MGVPSPELMASAFAERFNARDTQGFLQLYAQDAVLTFDGEDRAQGHDQIEGVLSGFLAAGLKFRAACASAHVHVDTALTRFRWELVDEAGTVAASGVSVEVQQRGPDGRWRMIIDDTNGGNRE